MEENAGRENEKKQSEEEDVCGFWCCAPAKSKAPKKKDPTRPTPKPHESAQEIPVAQPPPQPVEERAVEDHSRSEIPQQSPLPSPMPAQQPEETKLLPPEPQIFAPAEGVSEEKVHGPPPVPISSTSIARVTAITEMDPAEKPQPMVQQSPVTVAEPVAKVEAPNVAAVPENGNEAPLPGHNLDAADFSADPDDVNCCFEVEEHGKEEALNVSKVHCIEVNFKHGGAVNSREENHTFMAGKQGSFQFVGGEKLYTEPDDTPKASGGVSKEQLFRAVKAPEPAVNNAKPKAEPNKPTIVSPPPLAELPPIMSIGCESSEVKATPVAKETKREAKVEEIPVFGLDSPAGVKGAIVPENTPAVERQPKESPAPLTVRIEKLDKSTPVADSAGHRLPTNTASSHSPSLKNSNNNVAEELLSMERTESKESATSKAKEEVKLSDMQMQENLSDLMQYEGGEDEGALSRSVRDSYALPTPSYSSYGHNVELMSEAGPGRGLSREPSEARLSVGEDKVSGNSDDNLKTILQEREMLWAALEGVDRRLKDSTRCISSYQGQVEHLKRTIVRTCEQITKAKRENVSLQQIFNSQLLAKLTQYPI